MGVKKKITLAEAREIALRVLEEADEMRRQYREEEAKTAAPGFQGRPPDIPEDLWERAGKITKAEWVELFVDLFTGGQGLGDAPMKDAWLIVTEERVKQKRKEKKARTGEGSDQ